MSDHVVESGSLRLAVGSLGDRRHPPLLLLPGITMPRRGMYFLANELVAEFWVLVPDLRGRGDSSRAEAGRYRLEDYAGDVSRMLAALDVTERETLVVGHSLGARIAASAAANGSQFRGLVMVDPPLSNADRPYPTPWVEFERQLRVAQSEDGLADVRRTYPSWPDAEQRLRPELVATCDPDAVRETWQAFETDDFIDLWSRLTTPAALIRGEQSPVVLPHDLGTLSSIRPDIPAVSVPQAGHMVPWDNLAGFLHVLMPILRDMAGQP